MSMVMTMREARAHMPMPTVRRAATYARVSSEDQADRGTIGTQDAELDRRLSATPGIEIVARYRDEGVSGTIPVAQRPDGRRLMADAEAGRFDELHVYATDRLGRDLVDLVVIRRRLDKLGIRLITVTQGEPDLLSFDIQAAVADHARRVFLRLSADGINRAAAAGRYVGGVHAYGYIVQGAKESAHIVPDEEIVSGPMSAADAVRLMYRRIGLDDWSCRRVADELQALDVPTHTALKEARGVRTKHTRGEWLPGRVRNTVVQPVYRGELLFGRRSKKARVVISAGVEPLVSEELWQATQDALARHRIAARNTPRVYLLRSVVRCSLCGLTYVGSQGRDGVWWLRCGGQLNRRRGTSRCLGRGVRGDLLESTVWRDIEHWLRHPGEILDELDGRAERDAEAERLASEETALRAALEAQRGKRTRAIDLAQDGLITKEEVRSRLAEIDARAEELRVRLAALASRDSEPAPIEDDLLKRLRVNLDAGLTDDERAEIIRLLVRITVRTTVHEDATKDAVAAISYRFPAVVATPTAKGSSQPRAGNVPGSGFGHGRGRW